MKTARQRLPFLINRSFALLWVGQIISTFGDFLFDTTLTLWIVTHIARGQSWAPLAVGGVLLAASAPTLLIGPLAGVFVDRWVKKQTMLRMDGLRALLIALLVPFALYPPLLKSLPTSIELGIMYLVVFLASSCAQFFNPSALALIGDIVEPSLRAQAKGLTQTLFSLSMLFAPPLASLLFFSVGVYLAIIFNALSFAISFLLIRLIQAPSAASSVEGGQGGHFWREFEQGLGLFFGNRILLSLLIAGFLVTLFGGAFNTLGIFFLQNNLHEPLTLYGFLSTAIGSGVALGAGLAAFFAQRLKVTRVLSIGLTLIGGVIMLFSRLTHFLPALLVIFLYGFLAGCVNVAISPILLQVTPRKFVGRVAAVLNPVLALALLLSVMLVSYLDNTLLHHFQISLWGMRFGSIDTIFLATGVLALLGGIYVMISLHGVTIAESENRRSHIAEAETSSPMS